MAQYFYNTKNIYKGILIFEKLPWKILHCFHEHEHKCSRSTLTSPMHNLPITSLFVKVFRNKRQVNFLYFALFFCLFHPQLNKNKRENKIYLVKKANKHTRKYQPHAIAPRQRRQIRAWSSRSAGNHHSTFQRWNW